MSWSIRCAAIAALFILPATADAQSRSSVWARLSAGRGDLRVNCNICGGADQSSWAADVSAGGWVGSRTKLGGELGVWRLGGDEATQRVMLLGAVSQIYPVRVPAFLKLGVGLLTYGSSDGEETLSATSFAAQAGIGFDVRVPGGYIVVPHATLVQGFNGGLYLDGDKVTGWSRVTLVRLGLGVGVGR
jgi:hypothetical protein